MGSLGCSHLLFCLHTTFPLPFLFWPTGVCLNLYRNRNSKYILSPSLMLLNYSTFFLASSMYLELLAIRVASDIGQLAALVVPLEASWVTGSPASRIVMAGKETPLARQFLVPVRSRLVSCFEKGQPRTVYVEKDSMVYQQYYGGLRRRKQRGIPHPGHT